MKLLSDLRKENKGKHLRELMEINTIYIEDEDWHGGLKKYYKIIDDTLYMLMYEPIHQNAWVSIVKGPRTLNNDLGWDKSEMILREHFSEILMESIL